MPSRKLSSLTGTPEGLARAHGIYNIVCGAWPLVHRRSFEALFGPKEDEWLQQTAGALMVSAGCSQLLAANTPEGRAHARRTGLGTAATLLAVDLAYAPAGRIRWTYLLDAAVEAAWILAWIRTARPSADRTTAPNGRREAGGSPGTGTVSSGRAPAAGRSAKGDLPVAGAGVDTSRVDTPRLVTAAHIEQLLGTDDPGAALVAVGGRVEVVSSDEAPGGLVVAEREDVLRTLPEGDRSPDALRRVARALDTAVSEMGG